MKCDVCDGKGYVMVRCCGSRPMALADCCCAYSGGYDADECPGCGGNQAEDE